jgi:hypothetical protein
MENAEPRRLSPFEEASRFEANKMDLSAATKVLAEAQRMTAALTEASVPDGQDFTRNNALTAAVGRNLLRRVELCRLAADEVQTQYWRFGGHPDPRL